MDVAHVVVIFQDILGKWKQNVSILGLIGLRMMEMVVTAGAVTRAKL